MTLGIRRITGSCNKVLVQSFDFHCPWFVSISAAGSWLAMLIILEMSLRGEVSVCVLLSLCSLPLSNQRLRHALLRGFSPFSWSPAAALTVKPVAEELKIYKEISSHHFCLSPRQLRNDHEVCALQSLKVRGLSWLMWRVWCTRLWAQALSQCYPVWQKPHLLLKPVLMNFFCPRNCPQWLSVLDSSSGGCLWHTTLLVSSVSLTQFSVRISKTF